jgi:hypothetical protein
LAGENPEWCQWIPAPPANEVEAQACILAETEAGRVDEAIYRCCGKYPVVQSFNCSWIGEACAVNEGAPDQQQAQFCPIYCAHVERDKPEWCSRFPAPVDGDDGNNANAGESGGIGGGAIAGIVIAVIAVAAGIGVLVFFFVVKKKEAE